MSCLFNSRIIFCSQLLDSGEWLIVTVGHFNEPCSRVICVASDSDLPCRRVKISRCYFFLLALIQMVIVSIEKWVYHVRWQYNVQFVWIIECAALSFRRTSSAAVSFPVNIVDFIIKVLDTLCTWNMRIFLHFIPLLFFVRMCFSLTIQL